MIRMSHNPNLRAGDETSTPTRVRIQASDKLVADALSAALSDDPSIEVAGAAETAHVVLWDSGSVAVGVADKAPLQRLQLAAAEPGVPVLALARDEAHATQLLGAGARGAVLRQASAPRLAAALVAIRYGFYVVDIELASASLPGVLPASTEAEAGEAGLTAREREVLAHLAQGLSNKSIARRLSVSIHTIKFHVNSILSKLDADSRTQAVTSAVRRGLVSL